MILHSLKSMMLLINRDFNNKELKTQDVNNKELKDKEQHNIEHDFI